MKKMLFAVVVLTVGTKAVAQDSTAQKPKMGLYTFVYNNVPDGYVFPLLGFVNQAQGNHTSLEAGFINTAGGHLMGLQAGFVNTAGKSTTGVQAGFVNATGDSLVGVQSGFVNTVQTNVLGGQFGFTNTAGQCVRGIQSGFVNTAGDSLTGLQSGFINSVSKKVQGAQLGFVNTTQQLQGMQAGFANNASGTEGVQLGFVNRARRVKGMQVGFINVADTVENGMAFGFLSIVKKGGYTAVECSMTEMFPANLSFKIGLRRFYTVFVLSYNPDHQNAFSVGSGFGAVFPLGQRFYLNPEALAQNNIGDFTQQTVSFTPHIGFAVTQRFHLSAGPSVVWNCIYEGDSFYSPFYSLSSHTLDSKNRLLTGVRVGLRYNFKW